MQPNCNPERPCSRSRDVQALVGGPAVDPSRPEILLYAPRANGRLELVGIEYFVPAASVTTTPTLFGRTFGGPMAGHNPSMPVHYELHAWLWAANPAGLFAPFNPNVSCA